MGQTQDNIVPDSAPAGEGDLADQIEALLGDIESTQHAIAQAVGDRPNTGPTTNQALGDDGVAEATAPGQSMHGESAAAAELTLNPEVAAQSAIDQAQQSLGDLSSVVDELLSPEPTPLPASEPAGVASSHVAAISPAPEVPPEPTSPEPAVAPPANADNIHSLDEELAKLTDELLADPNASVPAQPVEAAPEPVPPPEAGLTRASEPAPAEPAPATSPAPPPAPPEPRAPETARVEPKSAAKSQERAATPARPSFWEAHSPKLLRVMALASLPLRGRPEGFRSALGVMAAGTALMGAALWVIVLTRSQPLDEAHSGSFDFEHASLPAIPHPDEKNKHEEGAGHAEDPHAEPAKDSHGDAKKDAHGEAKKDGKPGDTHGEKKPPPKKTSKSKSASKKGKDAKPPPKKDDGHGGGH